MSREDFEAALVRRNVAEQRGKRRRWIGCVVVVVVVILTLGWCRA